MKIYEYRKHLINGQIIDPEFVTNSGHWYDSESDTYIAIMADKLPYYVPDTLVTLTEDELIARVQRLHSNKPFKQRVGVMGSGGYETEDEMTNEQVAEMVRNWLKEIYI